MKILFFLVFLACQSFSSTTSDPSLIRVKPPIWRSTDIVVDTPSTDSMRISWTAPIEWGFVGLQGIRRYQCPFRYDSIKLFFRYSDGDSLEFFHFSNTSIHSMSLGIPLTSKNPIDSIFGVAYLTISACTTYPADAGPFSYPVSNDTIRSNSVSLVSSSTSAEAVPEKASPLIKITNLSSDKIGVSITGPEVIYSIEAYNVNGKLLFRQNGSNSQSLAISKQGLAPGLLGFRVRTSKGIMTLKWVLGEP